MWKYGQPQQMFRIAIRPTATYISARCHVSEFNTETRFVSSLPGVLRLFADPLPAKALRRRLSTVAGSKPVQHDVDHDPTYRDE